MKPPSFEYCAPRSLDEAISYLAEYGDEARPLAGGQSLIPMLALRLAAPTALIDLNRVAALSFVAECDAPEGGDLQKGGLRIGAMTRTHALERSEDVRRRQPLLAAAIPWIAHFPIRTRGTIGGSLAHADPSAELPAVAVALDARMRIAGRGGEREVAAADFFVSMFETALRPGEILTEIVLPPFPARRAFGFHEIARRKGDFAMAGAAIWFDDADARAVAFGLTTRPERLGHVEAALRAGERGEARIREAAREDLGRLDLNDDLHASAQWRLDVGPVIVARIVAAAGRPGAARAERSRAERSRAESLQ